MLLNAYVRMRNVMVGRKGQGMTEYIILVAVVAIVLIASVKSFRVAIADRIAKAIAAIRRM